MVIVTGIILSYALISFCVVLFTTYLLEQDFFYTTMLVTAVYLIASLVLVVALYQQY